MYQSLRNEIFDWATHPMCLPMQVNYSSLTVIKYVTLESGIVADISVMLALMAGRNANETMGIVREGLVRFDTFLLPTR